MPHNAGAADRVESRKDAKSGPLRLRDMSEAGARVAEYYSVTYLGEKRRLVVSLIK